MENREVELPVVLAQDDRTSEKTRKIPGFYLTGSYGKLITSLNIGTAVFAAVSGILALGLS
jgi:hypothetical protein